MSKYDVSKLAALAMLNEGSGVTAAARKFGVPITVVKKWKTELEEGKPREAIDVVTNVDMAVLGLIAEEVKDSLEDIVENPAELVDGVVAKIDTLQVLNTDMQSCASTLVSKIASLSYAARTPMELEILSNSLATLQSAFFAKGTNVNALFVQGNASTTEISKYSDLQRGC